MVRFIARSCSPVERAVIAGTTGPARTGHLLLGWVFEDMARGTVPVNRVGTNVRARFRLNETMQKYALERLHDAGEVDATRSKHLRWYGQFGVSAEADSFSSRLLPLFDRLDAEASTIRLALQYCIENEAQLDAGLDFAASLHFWWAARSFTEAISPLQSLLGAGNAGDRPRARALFVLGKPQ